MKFLSVALLLVALAATACAMNSSWGSRNSTDYLLASDRVVDSAHAGTYSSMQYNFPTSGQMNTRTISAVYVYDKFTNSSGATASLWSGGPGYTFVSLNFKSQYGKGINSTVEIYGK